MIEEEKANKLAELIIPMDLSGMDEQMRLQIRDSALSEQGNIILGAFLNALAQITGWVLPTTAPAVAHDMLGSIMDLVASMFGISRLGLPDDGLGREADGALSSRSEERRVGKECRSRWSPYH